MGDTPSCGRIMTLVVIVEHRRAVASGELLGVDIGGDHENGLDHLRAPERHQHVGDHGLGQDAAVARGHGVGESLLGLVEAFHWQDGDRPHDRVRTLAARLRGEFVCESKRPAGELPALLGPVHAHVGLQNSDGLTWLIGHQPVEEPTIGGADAIA